MFVEDFCQPINIATDKAKLAVSNSPGVSILFICLLLLAVQVQRKTFTAVYFSATFYLSTFL